MGTYIYGINRTKQHKTYGTIGVLNFLYKPSYSSRDEKQLKWEERTDNRILNRWATETRIERQGKYSERWGYQYDNVYVPSAWAFPRVVSMGGKELYYYKGTQPIWNDNYETQVVPLADYIAQGGIVEVYDPVTKTMTPPPPSNTTTHAKVTV